MSGFPVRPQTLSSIGFKSCISWLAQFHACFLGNPGVGLWETGSYWHLQTRPDEFNKMEPGDLKRYAGKIDEKLSDCKFTTLVHGDAKLANFCFSKNKEVAAVDFQYIGQGCGMKDLIYFMSSCFDEADCSKYEFNVLEIYFNELKLALSIHHPEIRVNHLEDDWRSMFQIAWADFQRFIKGWSPLHFKINSYSEAVTQRVINEMKNVLGEKDLKELQLLAEEIARKAGMLIQKEKNKGFIVDHKLVGSSEASRVVTKVDHLVESYILKSLSGSIEKFDLGILTEEKPDNRSRFDKNYFWCIDPLDGTLPFIEGKPGYSVSISLVSKKGISVLGVVYDPVKNNLYSAVRGLGATKNGNRLLKSKVINSKFSLVTDRSFSASIDKKNVIQKFRDKHEEIVLKCIGGAVLNALWVIENQPSCYFKSIKKEDGGGSIWDFSATACIAIESGCKVTDSKGDNLNFNSKYSTFMNQVGVSFT